MTTPNQLPPAPDSLTEGERALDGKILAAMGHLANTARQAGFLMAHHALKPTATSEASHDEFEARLHEAAADLRRLLALRAAPAPVAEKKWVVCPATNDGWICVRHAGHKGSHTDIRRKTWTNAADPGLVNACRELVEAFHADRHSDQHILDVRAALEAAADQEREIARAVADEDAASANAPGLLSEVHWCVVRLEATKGLWFNAEVRVSVLEEAIEQVLTRLVVAAARAIPTPAAPADELVAAAGAVCDMALRVKRWVETDGESDPCTLVELDERLASKTDTLRDALAAHKRRGAESAGGGA